MKIPQPNPRDAIQKTPATVGQVGCGASDMDVDLDGMATAYPDESASIADLASWVQKNTAIIEMFMRNGLELAELRLDNLGRRENGQIVVLDYSTLA